MSQPYVGEVRAVGFNFAPAGWAFCQGQLLPISDYETLFNLIGTIYGGDGQSTFGLPNLQGRIPIHQGTSSLGTTYVIGQLGGVESVTIASATYPQHTHTLFASSAAGAVSNPANNAAGSGSKIYAAPADIPTIAMNAAMVGLSGGGGQPHDNLQPYLALNWIISLFGIYPTPS
jgi:microcystin-dependent protein